MFTCQNKGTHLFVEVSGLYSLELLMSTVHKVADLCRNETLNKALIDLRNMHGDPSILDRYQIGVEIANTWRGDIQVAAIVKADILNRMIENTAVNRGAKLFATADLEEAMNWLGIEK